MSPVVITDGSVDYTPKTTVYIWRAMRSPDGFEDALEHELELLAAMWPSDVQAKKLALAVEQDQLTGLLEEFGLGRDRSDAHAATSLA